MRTTSTDFAGSSIPNSAFRIPRSREFHVPHSRRAFTLVEMLVVIAIIIVLMGLVLAFYPKREVRLAAQGADQLQTLLASAKSRAMRDNAPRGIRLITNDGGATFRSFEYVEVPEPFIPAGATLTANSVDNRPGFQGRAVFNVNLTINGSVQVGDLLEITHGVGSIHRVIGFNGPTIVVLASPIPAASNSNLFLTQNFRFIRQSRPLMGETPFQLPDKVLVSGANSRNIPSSYAAGNWEIMFSPSGQVINATAGRIVLWVQDDAGVGGGSVSAPTLLTVYSYTGSTAAHPMGPAANVYQFTQDGRSSGQ